jgi:hypothetical protein
MLQSEPIKVEYYIVVDGEWCLALADAVQQLANDGHA